MAALICTRPGHRPRLIYRIHLDRGPAKGRRKGFTETHYARLFDAAHQQLGGPIVLVWDNMNTHVSRTMRQLIDARLWLTVYQLPPYAPEFNPVEGVWAHLKRPLANLTKHSLDQLTTLVKTRLKRMQYRPRLIEGLVAKTGLQPPTSTTPAVKDLLELGGHQVAVHRDGVAIQSGQSQVVTDPNPPWSVRSRAGWRGP